MAAQRRNNIQENHRDTETQRTRLLCTGGPASVLVKAALIFSVRIMLPAILLFPAPVHAYVIVTSADAHIDGASRAENFGTNEMLSLEQTELGGNKAYLRFDASSWVGTNLSRLESLTVTWAASTSITRTLAFFLITGTNANNWSETNLTWINAPANNVGTTSNRNFVAYPGQTLTLLGSVQYAAGAPRELTLQFTANSVEERALLNALNSGDRRATIGVQYNSSSVSSVGIYAREYNAGVSAAKLQVATAIPLVPPLTDAAFFAKLDLARPGFDAVRSAIMANDFALAKQALGTYYRQRAGVYHYYDSQNPAANVSNPAGVLQSSQPLVQRTGDFNSTLWNGDIFDWETAVIRYKERMYFFETYGAAAAVETGEDVARALVNLIRSFAYQYRSPAGPSGGMWATMSTGIRMRSGWPAAFQCLLHSPAFTDEDIVLFLKSVWDQTDYIYRNPSETSNWLTFEMAGLYTSGVVYPEFRDAYEWRRKACQTALDDIGRGWLPDGMSIEKSATYGTFFSNYFYIYDLASFVGRLNEFRFGNFPASTEHLFDAYVKLMTPDRLTPVLNDGGQAGVVDILTTGLAYFPLRDDFRWIVTKGKQGTPPVYASTVFPYAGYLVARSGWETNANYLLCDAGAVGYRHAHQDKLHVVMWAYGHQILFDSERPAETDEWTYMNYIRDTFSHSTGLVDNRPQRRRWYNAPHPNQMPYQPLTDIAFETAEASAWLSGSYTDSYGLAGSVGNDSYPYKVPSNFYDGWGTPAKHYRQVAFAAPDVFLVQDWFVPSDAASHNYEIRWQLDSTSVQSTGYNTETKDANAPNLAVIPLRTNALSVATASAKLTPEVMGWKVVSEQPRATTTLRHTRTGTGWQGFVTLLYPMRKGVSTHGVSFQEQNGAITIQLPDARNYTVRPASQPTTRLTIDDADFKDTDADGIPDWWEMKYFSGPTNAAAAAIAANKINTLREAYLCGIDPADPAARFKLQGKLQSGQLVLSWAPALLDRSYELLWSTNLAQGFQVKTNLAGPANVFTNAPGSAGFYQIRVQRAL